MERGSDQHGPRMDDDMQREAEPLERSGVQPHRAEWRQPEPSTDEEPEAIASPDGIYRGGTPPGLDPEEVETRTEVARHLDPSLFPTDRQRVLRNAAEHNAPDAVLAVLARLPEDQRFTTMQDMWRALGGGSERRP